MRTYDVDRHDNLSMVVRLFIKVVLCSVIEVCEAALRWYGHVLRKDDEDWVKKCMEHEVEGSRPRGRPGKRLYVRTVKHVS